MAYRGPMQEEATFVDVRIQLGRHSLLSLYQWVCFYSAGVGACITATDSGLLGLAAGDVRWWRRSEAPRIACNYLSATCLRAIRAADVVMGY